MKGEFPLAKGLLGHLDAVELRVVKAKLVIERDLLLEDLAAVGQNLGDCARCSGRSRLTPRAPTLSRIQTPNGWHATPILVVS